MKLQVGDIEMDSHAGISFGGRGMVAARGETNFTANDAGDRRALLQRLSVWSSGAYIAVGVLALGVIVGLALVSGVFSGLQGGAGALILIPAPGLLLVAGFAFWRALMGGQRRAQTALDGVDEQRAARLGAHLSTRFEPASVEELMVELGWQEEAVVRGLQVGMERLQIVEDLDLDSGHWIYAFAPPLKEEISRKVLPIGERIKRLT